VREDSFGSESGGCGFQGALNALKRSLLGVGDGGECSTLLESRVGVIVRAWEFAGVKLHGGAHD
jgi:hypothetical protein